MINIFNTISDNNDELLMENKNKFSHPFKNVNAESFYQSYDKMENKNDKMKNSAVALSHTVASDHRREPKYKLSYSYYFFRSRNLIDTNVNVKKGNEDKYINLRVNIDSNMSELNDHPGSISDLVDGNLKELILLNKTLKWS